MKSVSKYYEQAELALAAYAVLSPGIGAKNNGEDYEDALQVAGMTESQAKRFSVKYNVVDQFTHADYGLSVTVFEADGKKYLAIRGTNDLADLWTDFIDIVMRGTPELQKQYTELRKQVGKWMVDGVLSEGFTVAGHSLGGFLAGALFVDFPADIEHLYLYNTPGVGGYQAVIRQILGLEGASLNFLQASNIRADAGLSGIAGLGLSWGLPISIAIEDQSLIGVVTGESPMALNHSQQVLTDSLAVYALLEQLSPNMRPETFSAILRASSMEENSGLERIVDTLERIFDINSTPLVTGKDNRDALYKAIYAIQDNEHFKQLEGSSFINLSGREVELATYDFGQFIALYYLLPFTFFEAAASSVLAHAHADLFERWQADFLLPAEQRLEFTDAWLTDRSAMLSALIMRNFADNNDGYAQDANVLFQDVTTNEIVRTGAANDSGREWVLFGSQVADELIGDMQNDRLYSGGGDDTLQGSAGNDYLEGGAGDDQLDGGEDNDTLIGGLGNDTLRGGGGLDLLRGGLGNDRYEFMGNFGTDIVEDEDGTGSLWIGGVQVGALWETAGAPGVYHDVEERFRAIRVFTDGEWTLAISSLISEHKGTVFVRGWAEGRLGVTLGEVEAEIPSGSVIVGDIKKKTLTEDGTESYVFSATGYESDGEQANAQDILYGTSQADHILGLGGNDGINGGDGDDWIDGGDGDDLLFGGGGADTLLGGAGNDYIFAGRAAEFERPSSVEYVWEPRNGEPIITSGFSWGVVQSLNQDAGSIVYVKRSALSENNAGTVVFGGAGDDVITGGTGEDALYGGDDNDRVYGLHGNDALFGDAGDDLLVGDGNTQGVTMFQYTAAEHHGNDTLDGGAGNDTLIGQGGHDWLFGGDGDDTLAGDADLTGNTITFIPAERHGNDYLDGGSGNDVLIGGLGNDTLMGGEGNDTLIGGDGVSHSLFGMEDNDWLDGGSGNDELRGRSGDDTLYGGIGNDSLMGDDGNDWLSGDSGNDSLWGGVGDDTLYGGLGDDYVDGGEGQDWLEGGSGNDNIQGMEGDDTLFGGAGGDTLNGGGGNDWLAGGDGDDGLWGKEGNDTLVGGKGLDYLVGGGGDDTYIFNSGDAEVVLASGTVGEQFLSFADTIDDNEGHNTLVLSTVYSLTQIRSKRQENDLVLYYGGNEGVIINNGFVSTMQKSEIKNRKQSDFGWIGLDE